MSTVLLDSQFELCLNLGRKKRKKWYHFKCLTKSQLWGHLGISRGYYGGRLSTSSSFGEIWSKKGQRSRCLHLEVIKFKTKAKYEAVWEVPEAIMEAILDYLGRWVRIYASLRPFWGRSRCNFVQEDVSHFNIFTKLRRKKY